MTVLKKEVVDVNLQYYPWLVTIHYYCYNFFLKGLYIIFVGHIDGFFLFNRVGFSLNFSTE